MEKTATQLPPQLAIQQLQQLLVQEEFKRSPILTKFLEFVVHTKLSGREDEIKEYTIAVKALGRPADFSPQLDGIVRIHASRLRSILFQYYHGTGKNDPVIISIPKGSYAPVFEVNNGNLNHDLDINAIQRPAPIHKVDFIKPVVAILPFHDLSSGQNNNDFLTTLGEQLSMELARLDHLSVISFFATRKLDAALKHLNDLKSEGIDYILTGSVRFFNDTIRLNIQLLNVGSGNILWSNTFVRRQLIHENAFDMQDEIVSQVANAVADDPKMMSTLNRASQEQNGGEKSPIQDAISRYFDYIYDYNSTKFGPTLAAMEAAYKVAPDHILVVSILSKLYLDLYACAVEHDTAHLQKGMELAKKAVSLGPYSQRAHKALAWGLILAGDKQGEEAANQCIAINPMGSSSLSTMGLGLIMLGQSENGYSMLKRSLRLHQNSSACAKLGFSLYYYHNKDYHKCSQWLSVLSPFDIPFSSLLGVAVNGKLKGKIVRMDESVLRVKGHEKDIVSRIAINPILRSEIKDGWKQAGFVS